MREPLRLEQTTETTGLARDRPKEAKGANQHMLRVFATLFAGLVVLGLGAALAGFYMLWRLSEDLPSYEHLADYAPPVMTRVHAGDGSLIAEYARERRMFVPIEAVPDHVVEAFLAAEDKNFYSHAGIDFTASCAPSSPIFST